MGSWLGGGSSGGVELVEGVSGGASGRGGCRATCGASVYAPASSMVSGIATVESSMVWAIQLIKVRLAAAATWRTWPARSKLLDRDSPYWQSSGSMGNPNEMVSS